MIEFESDSSSEPLFAVTWDGATALDAIAQPTEAAGLHLSGAFQINFPRPASPLPTYRMIRLFFKGEGVGINGM